MKGSELFVFPTQRTRRLGIKYKRRDEGLKEIMPKLYATLACQFILYARYPITSSSSNIATL